MEKYIKTSISASFAEIITHPFDYIKTNRQVSKQTLLTITKNILNTRGIIGFYPSILPAIMGHNIYTTLRVQMYENLKTHNSNFIYKLFLGGFCGGISQLITSPLDLMKIKLQIGQFNNTIECFRYLYNNKSFLQLYCGWKPNVIRAVLVNMGDIVFYDHTKKLLLENGFINNIKTHLLAGFSSGFFSTLFSCPADVLKSRMMADTNNKYVLRTLINIINKEGLFSLWYGFFPTLLRLTPWQLTFWVTYEYLKK